MKRYLLTIIILLILVFVLIIANPFCWFDALRDPFIKANTLNLNLYDSYAIDTNGLKEYDKKWTGNYEYREVNEPFTYFIQLPLDKSIMEAVSRELQLKLPDELLDYMYSSEVNYEYMLLSFGRELKEIKYKYLSYFSDGVNAKAEITFEEQHQNDLVYVYFIDKNVYFWRKSYYVMTEGKRVFLGNNLYYAYN